MPDPEEMIKSGDYLFRRKRYAEEISQLRHVYTVREDGFRTV